MIYMRDWMMDIVNYNIPDLYHLLSNLCYPSPALRAIYRAEAMAQGDLPSRGEVFFPKINVQTLICAEEL